MDFEIKKQYHFDDLLQVMRILRSEEGCMWDRQQDHHSIRRDFIEETYEVCEAIDNEDTELLKEELGDVLFQVVFHTTIEEEQGHFDMDDVIDGICKKMIYRHPHVFKDVQVNSTQDILNNWDDLKKTEKHQESVVDTMNSVARTLPALIRAEKVMKKAEKAGFEWNSVENALDKVQEELDEVRRADEDGRPRAGRFVGRNGQHDVRRELPDGGRDERVLCGCVRDGVRGFAEKRQKKQSAAFILPKIS